MARNSSHRLLRFTTLKRGTSCENALKFKIGQSEYDININYFIKIVKCLALSFTGRMNNSEIQSV